jgi:hypothetical protein
MCPHHRLTLRSERSECLEGWAAGTAWVAPFETRRFAALLRVR